MDTAEMVPACFRGFTTFRGGKVIYNDLIDYGFHDHKRVILHIKYYKSILHCER